MKLISRLFSILLAISVPALGQQVARPVEGLHENDPSAHALVGGILVTPEGEKAGTVIIRGGRFTAVGDGVPIPEGARIWDVKDKRIYAGLIEPWWERSPGGLETGPHWNPSVRPERRMADGYSLDDDDLEGRRKLGYAVAGLLEKGIFRGQASIVLLRDGERGEQVIEPAAGQVIDFATRKGYPNSLMGSVALVRQVLSDAAWYQASVKEHGARPSEVDRPATNASLAAIDLGQSPLWRARDETSFARIAGVAAEFQLEPAVLGNGEEYRRAGDLPGFRGKLFVPLNFPKRPAIEDAASGLDYSLAELEHWEFAPSNAAFLADNKIGFALTGNGIEDMGGKFWKNVRLAVERGLPAGEALAALTSRPAAVLNISDRCGSISTGLYANLIVADGDLFTDKEAVIEATWVEGLPYEFPDVHKPDASGVWEVKGIGDETQRWEIAKGAAPKVTVGEEKFKTRWQGDDLLLFPPASLVGGGEGTARMSASFDAEQGRLSGVAAVPGGKTFWWNAKRVGDLEDKDGKEGDESKEDDTESDPVPELVFGKYPAGAFGVEEELEAPAVLLVKGATIWTSGSMGVLEGADLLMKEGRIEAVGKDLAVPEGAKVIDAAGKHITPGLIDCHSHTAVSRGVNESSHAVTVEVRIGDSLNPTDINLYRQLGGGLTVANILHGSANPMGGQNQVIKLRWGSGADGLRFDGAKPGVKFALGENVKQSNWDTRTSRYPQTRMGVEQIMKDSFVAARDYRAARNRAAQSGAPHRRDLRMESLLEILDGRRIVHIHSYRQDEILMFVRLAQEFGFTVGTFQHVLEGYKVADEIAKLGAGGSTFSDWWVYKFEVEDAIPTNGALMHEAGVVTSFNSDDAELACRMNAEAAKAVKYGGVSPEEALKFVTINPAKQLRIDAKVGSLEKGKDADFVIWSAPPLSTYARAEQTWIDGRRYFDLKSDEALRARASAERERLVAKIMEDSVSDSDKEEDEEKKDADAEESVEGKPKKPERRLPWLPAWVGVVGACSSGERGLYHNGNNEHTCTGASCCGVR